MPARDGVHDGAMQKEWVKSIPCDATRSNVGVFTALSPYAPAWPNDQSSAMQNTMFGRSSRFWRMANDCLAKAVAAAEAPATFMKRRRERGMPPSYPLASRPREGKLCPRERLVPLHAQPRR